MTKFLFKGYQQGFWQGFFGMLIIAVGYLTLSMCLAEMCSLLTFGGTEKKKKNLFKKKNL